MLADRIPEAPVPAASGPSLLLRLVFAYRLYTLTNTITVVRSNAQLTTDCHGVFAGSRSIPRPNCRRYCDRVEQEHIREVHENQPVEMHRIVGIAGYCPVQSYHLLLRPLAGAEDGEEDPTGYYDLFGLSITYW